MCQVTSTDADSSSIPVKQLAVAGDDSVPSSQSEPALVTIPSPSEELEQALMALQWAATQNIDGHVSSDTNGLETPIRTDTDALRTPADHASSMTVKSSRWKRKTEDDEGSHNYQRAKAHKGRGSEQDYICSYCKKVKTSTSAGSDGRVRIRCECGGQRMDGKSRLHAAWVPVDPSKKPVRVTPPARPPGYKTIPATFKQNHTGGIVFVDETIQMKRSGSPPIVMWQLVPQSMATGYPVSCL